MANLGFRIASAIHNAVYRLSGGKIARTSPLLYTPAGDGYAVIASKGGAPKHPLWYLNLQASPHAEVTVGRETRHVHARDAEGDERERLWRALADAYPGYDRYAQKTSRRIPVVVLEPAGH